MIEASARGLLVCKWRIGPVSRTPRPDESGLGSIINIESRESAFATLLDRGRSSDTPGYERGFTCLSEDKAGDKGYNEGR
jgi:hypothetical protein